MDMGKAYGGGGGADGAGPQYGGGGKDGGAAGYGGGKDGAGGGYGDAAAGGYGGGDKDQKPFCPAGKTAMNKRHYKVTSSLGRSGFQQLRDIDHFRFPPLRRNTPTGAAHPSSR